MTFFLIDQETSITFIHCPQGHWQVQGIEKMNGQVITVKGSIWTPEGKSWLCHMDILWKELLQSAEKTKKKCIRIRFERWITFWQVRKVTLNEWKIVKNCSISTIHGFIYQGNKITFSDNTRHEFYRVELSFTIYEHPSPCPCLSFKILYLHKFRGLNGDQIRLSHEQKA